MKLFPVKVGGGSLDLSLDLTDPVLDSLFLACAVNYNGVFLCYLDLLCATQLRNLCVLEFKTQLLGDHLTACEDSDVLKHFLAPVAEAGSLYRNAGKCAAELIYDKCGQSLALDVLSNDNQLLAALNDLLEQGEYLLNGGYLLVCDKKISVVNNSFHFIRIGNHIGSDVAAVKLHTLNNFRICLRSLGFLDSDNAVSCNLFHSLGNELSYVLVGSGDSRNACDIVGALNGCGVCLDRLDCGFNSLCHTLFNDHWVSSRGNVFHTLADKSLCKQSSGCSTVSCRVVGLCGNFLDELCAHVLKSVLKLYLLGDGNAVVGDEGSAELLVQNNVSALGAEGDLNCVGKLVNARLERLSCFLAVNNIFSHIKKLLYK